MMHRWLLLAALSLALVGCGGRVDPRTRPGYVDTSDPREGVKQMKASSPLAKQKNDQPKSSGKTGGS